LEFDLILNLSRRF